MLNITHYQRNANQNHYEVPSRRDLRAVRLAVGVIVAVVILSAVTASLLPPDFLPTEIFTFK